MGLLFIDNKRNIRVDDIEEINIVGSLINITEIKVVCQNCGEQIYLNDAIILKYTNNEIEVTCKYC